MNKKRPECQKFILHLRPIFKNHFFINLYRKKFGIQKLTKSWKTTMLS